MGRNQNTNECITLTGREREEEAKKGGERDKEAIEKEGGWSGCSYTIFMLTTRRIESA